MNVLRFCFADSVIWITGTDIQSAEQYLTTRQKDFANTHLSDVKKGDFLRSRALLNYIIGELREFPSDPATSPESAGAPHSHPILPCEMHGNLYVSLSHKKNFAAVVSSNHPSYGIDLELMKPTQPGLRNKVLSQGERIRFSAEKLDTLTAFSFKESVFKAINRKFPDVRSFYQCEIVEVRNDMIEAKMIDCSAHGLQLLGNIFRLKNIHGNFIVTVAKPK